MRFWRWRDRKAEEKTEPIHFTGIILWLVVINPGVVFGAEPYEARVFVPLWTSAPPESLMATMCRRARCPQALYPAVGGEGVVVVGRLRPSSG
jgi:hypothetical protein